jgi:hypothetical protein
MEIGEESSDLQHVRTLAKLKPVLVPMLQRQFGVGLLLTAALIGVLFMKAPEVPDYVLIFGILFYYWGNFIWKLYRIRTGVYGDNASELTEIAMEIAKQPEA